MISKMANFANSSRRWGGADRENARELRQAWKRTRGGAQFLAVELFEFRSRLDSNGSLRLLSRKKYNSARSPSEMLLPLSFDIFLQTIRVHFRMVSGRCGFTYEFGGGSRTYIGDDISLCRPCHPSVGLTNEVLADRGSPLVTAPVKQKKDAWRYWKRHLGTLTSDSCAESLRPVAHRNKDTQGSIRSDEVGSLRGAEEMPVHLPEKLSNTRKQREAFQQSGFRVNLDCEVLVEIGQQSAKFFLV